MTKHTTSVYMPEGMQPKLHIPRHIAEEWMIYGMIGYRDHNSEWGCAVKMERDGDYGPVTVTDYHMYELDASGAYWESMEGEREKHAALLIEQGKEDEMHLWNGLFHTHPIGSGATMSGTDMDQLKELAGQNYWGISIISPANRGATVNPSEFLYHYADCRQFDNGMLVVDNLKPTIDAALPVADPYTEYAETMKTIMHKRPVNTRPAIWESKNDDIDRILRDVNSVSDEADMIMNRMFHPQVTHAIEPGDWVYIHKLSRDSDLLATYSQKDLDDLFAIENKVVKVSMATSGSISCNGVWLSPHEFEGETDPYVDFVYNVADKGSNAAVILNNQMARNKRVHPTKKMFVDAGIEHLYDECKNTITNHKKKKVTS